MLVLLSNKRKCPHLWDIWGINQTDIICKSNRFILIVHYCFSHYVHKLNLTIFSSVWHIESWFLQANFLLYTTVVKPYNKCCETMLPSVLWILSHSTLTLYSCSCQRPSCKRKMSLLFWCRYGSRSDISNESKSYSKVCRLVYHTEI